MLHILFLLLFSLFKETADERWRVLVANELLPAEICNALIDIFYCTNRLPLESASDDAIVVTHDEEHGFSSSYQDFLQIRCAFIKCDLEHLISWWGRLRLIGTTQLFDQVVFAHPGINEDAISFTRAEVSHQISGNHATVELTIS